MGAPTKDVEELLGVRLPSNERIANDTRQMAPIKSSRSKVINCADDRSDRQTVDDHPILRVNSASVDADVRPPGLQTLCRGELTLVCFKTPQAMDPGCRPMGRHRNIGFSYSFTRLRGGFKGEPGRTEAVEW